MDIILHNLKPTYMSESEVAGSDIYLQPEVRFGQGKRYLVSAKSGHGKSSLLNFIYGTNTHYDGTIEMCGHSSLPDRKGTALSTAEIKSNPAKNQAIKITLISYMFQDLCLFPQLTAMENVQLKNRLTDFKTDAEIEQMLDALLPADKKNQPVATLSLGQRQRVAAVRALCQPFAFLLLDEPFSHLDDQTASAVAAIIDKEVSRQNAGLIVTALGTGTHEQKLPVDVSALPAVSESTPSLANPTHFHYDAIFNL